MKIGFVGIMAKVVCKNCGHKNPSSAAVCENCGNFLFEDNRTAEPKLAEPTTEIDQEPAIQETTTTNVAEPEQTVYPEKTPVTIRINGGGAAQQLSTLSGFAILAAFFALEYLGILRDYYYFFVFLVLIFAVPTLLRRVGSVVQFYGPDFRFKNAENNESYPLMDVENIQINQYNRMDQILTIHFRENKTPLQVEFNSMLTFGSVITAFRRRRIPVIPANAPAGNQPA